MAINFKDPKVIAGIGVGAIALWFLFLRPSSRPTTQATGAATTNSDQGAQAGFGQPGQTGSDQGSGGGGPSAVDLSGIIDSILSANTQTHAYDLAYLGSFSANFLNYAEMADQQFAGLATSSNDSLIGLATSVINQPRQSISTADYPTTTNQPVPVAQPRGTSPPRAAAAMTGAGLGAGGGSAPRVSVAAPSSLGASLGLGLGSGISQPVSRPVVPANHGRGLGGPQGF